MSEQTRIPNIYRDVGHVKGLPLNWRDDVTGQLPAAVNAYLDHGIDGTPLTTAQLGLVREFMMHYIGAPCWDHMNEDESLAADLAALRRDVVTLQTPEQMREWIHRCLDLGIDPL